MNINREQLYAKLPLSTPFSLHVFPAYYCNFKCSYCLHSLKEDELRNLKFEKQLMDLDLYKKAIDSLHEFGDKLKAIIFAGHGEPLIHRDIDEMIEYAVKRNVAERVEIVTNASLLTNDLSDRLVAAGLHRLRISIQGVSTHKYKEVAGVDIAFEEIVENIRYFYNHRHKTNIYVKIIDIALESKEEEQKFHEIFAPISDVATIEYTIPFVAEIDYSKFNTNFEKCKQGHKQSSQICSMPFYMLVMEPNGNIIPCCSTSVPVVYGNVKDTGLKDIWVSQKNRNFLRLQLTDKSRNSVCRSCSVPAMGLQQGDYLDEHASDLLQYYK